LMETSASKSETIRMDIEFHYRVVKSAQNRTLLQMWLLIKGLTSALIEITTGNYRDIDFVVQSHADLLRAILEGNIEQAIRLLEAHLKIGQQMIITYLDSQSQE
jgi:DNA-binding FadR family transcriptional regulator